MRRSGPLLPTAGGLIGSRAAAAHRAAAAASTTPTFASYSKFDFVPGEKIIAMEDFTQDAIGDFPAKWNTDASGEVVTIAGQPGRWLKLTRAGFFTPDFITNLPDNATMEFDLAVPPTINAGFPIEVAMVQLVDLKRPGDWQTGPNSFLVTAHPSAADGVSAVTPRQDGTSAAANSTRTAQLAAQRGTPVHISLWRQRQRVRVYMKEEKVWDRSDKIKAESYGTLKEIAGVLTETADLKVQIVGHTDADGDDAANMDLSKRRAASVKAALTNEFKIDAGRMETDGKGESQPVDKNDNPAGKANNRRVEFVKR